MSVFQVADLIVTATLGVVGGYLAYSFRRQLALRVADRRLAAYAALWSRMGSASPVRLTSWIAHPLTLRERERLFRDFTVWYYESGNGIFVGEGTRFLYLRAKDNLVCPVECFVPGVTRDQLLRLSPEDQEWARGCLAIRQLSLLRTRMRADLEVYGTPYHVDLDESDRAFLRSCGESLRSPPWNRSTRRSVDVECRDVPTFPLASETGEATLGS
jgi:hypothetical protein